MQEGSAGRRFIKADLNQAGGRVLLFLPPAAVIRAKVYPTIKPNRNSFVWELSSDPTIFLYLDPDVSQAKFENTVAHEFHHIGLGSVSSSYDQKIGDLPQRARTAARWMSSFGEGMAMVAAAGGPDPHAASSATERAR